MQHLPIQVLLVFSVLIFTEAHPVSDNNLRVQKYLTSSPLRLRQEEVVEGLGLGEVGTNVGHIVSGVLTGNFADVFKGTLPFIDDDDVQTGVGSIFNALTNPLNRLWAAGQKQGLQYFGITEPTTANPLNANANANGTAALSVVATSSTPPPSTAYKYGSFLASLLAPGPSTAPTTEAYSNVDNEDNETRFKTNN